MYKNESMQSWLLKNKQFHSDYKLIIFTMIDKMTMFLVIRCFLNL